MLSYELFTVGDPLSSSQLASYRTLRLSALQTDPSSFSSNYARELAFTDDQWRERLDSPLKNNIIARTDEGSWVGMLSLVAPGGLPGASFPTNPGHTFVVFGMWVHPDHRGKGVGKRLLDTGLCWADKWAEDHLCGDALVVLTVGAHNVKARDLYACAGFEKFTVGDTEKAGRAVCMVRKCRP
ncbi:acyl-CoA N-acyltransferase [Cytidiella melzeri]|nr:acyl-CoA N-acyltransferase [Cytidiella melzeri]